MEWLELIRVRASEGNARAMAQVIRERFPDLLEIPNIVDVRFYTHAWNKSDVAIHLFWNAPPTPGKSRVGHQIAESLRFYGVVSHSIWVEET